MDQDFTVDLTEAGRNIAKAEVITIYFPLLRRTLLIDTRYDTEDDPLVRVVPMARSPEDRVRSLKRMRPRFPRPSSIVVIPWPKYAASLVRLGVYDKLEQRLILSGRERAVRALQSGLEELERLEREEMTAAVVSEERYHTLWRRRR